MNLPTTTARVLVASISAIAFLASGCATDAPDLDAAEPAASVPDVAGDPDLDTGEDHDGGVLVVDPEDHDPAREPGASGEQGATAPTDARPAAKPPAAKPAAKPIAGPAAKPVAKPAAKPATPASLADGAHAARLVRIERQTLTVDLVQVLNGEAARKAAKEAGDLDEDGTLPNDVYVKDLGKRVTVPVAGDGGFQIYDCSTGCELVGATLETLVDGSATPYGGANAHVSLRVDHGTVVSFVEIYLP